MQDTYVHISGKARKGRESSSRGFRLQRRSTARLGEEESIVGMERGVAASSNKEVPRRSASTSLVDSEMECHHKKQRICHGGGGLVVMVRRSRAEKQRAFD